LESLTGQPLEQWCQHVAHMPRMTHRDPKNGTLTLLETQHNF
jgi:hypothetical protein